MSTKVVTNKARFSYSNIWKPRAANEGDAPKFSITALIPKSDTETYKKLKAAEKEAAEIFRSKNGTASLPSNPVSPIHDGDGEKPNGGDYGPECKGHWVLTASCSEDRPPIIVDRDRNVILDQREVYSGCYGRVCVQFYGYNNRKKGIGCGLLSVQKLSDGTPLGASGGSASDFDDGFEDDDDLM